MRVVVAIGGNALLRRGEKPDASIEVEHVRAAAEALAPLAADHELVLCHGNGPQVGLLALESEADASLSRGYPLDALVAQTQGMIGYWLAQALRNAGVLTPVVTVVTQVVVAADDQAFALPTKPVGAVYSRDTAHRLARAKGWDVAADGTGWRRVVPSPEPVRVVELPLIDALLRARSVVICGGGGGVPVVEEVGALRGVEAVIDKDLTAALLAVALRADRLLVLTDVSAVMEGFGTAAARPLHDLSLERLHGLALAAGSMGPKVEACRRFVVATGKPAAIGSLEAAAELLAGTAGTQITPSGSQAGAIS